jgi:hypothetical protein
VTRSSLCLVVAFELAACGGPPRATLDRAALVDARGDERPLMELVRRAPITAVVFYSAHCSCQDAHDERLRALTRRFTGRAQFLLVDSEVGASAAREEAEAARRGYEVPIYIDRGAVLARALGAEYATDAVVLDQNGRVLFHGGIDSDRTHLTSDATPFLANALEDVLAGRAPRAPDAKTLGCALRTS